MRLLALTMALVCMAYTIPAQAQQANGTSKDDTNAAAENEIMAAARTRAHAFASGDCATWASYLDANFRDVEGNGTSPREAMMKECESANGLPDHTMERDVSDFHFQFVGNNVALVDYKYEVREHFGEVTFVDRIHQFDTYEKRQAKWVALVAVSAVAIQDPPTAKIDVATLDGFTGRYAWVGSKMVDTVTRKGDKLYIETTGDVEPTELVSESKDTFFVHGQLARAAFVRDANGMVIEEHAYSPADGQGYRAKKMN